MLNNQLGMVGFDYGIPGFYMLVSEFQLFL